MSDKFAITASGIMSALTTLTGLPVIWKDQAGIAAPELPPEQGQHCSAFCLCVKRSAVRLARCRDNDDKLVAAEAEKRRKPFIHRCHAGVAELVAPIFSQGVYIGALYMGPFRDQESVCKYELASDTYAALPEYDAERIKAAEKLLRLLEQEIGQQRQIMTLKRLVEEGEVGRLAPALEYIDHHYVEEISAEDAARRCCISRSRFLHLFKERCGMGFSECLTRRRIDAARQMLSGTELKVGEIAFRCGFQGQSYFGMVFRRVTGLSPNVYRQRFRVQQEP